MFGFLENWCARCQHWMQPLWCPSHSWKIALGFDHIRRNVIDVGRDL